LAYYFRSVVNQSASLVYCRGGSRILQGRVSNPSERWVFMHSRWYLLARFFSKKAP